MFADRAQVFGDSTRLLALIELIYSAVNDATLWPTILDQMGEAIRGEQTLLFAPLANPGAPNAQRSLRTAPEVVKDYLSHYASVNILAEPCDLMFPAGSVRYSHWAVPDAEFERSEFYCDFFRRHNMHYSIGLKVPLGEMPAAYFSCQRSKANGPFAEGEGLVYETLMPHLQRSLTLYWQMIQMQSKLLGLESALDSLQHAVFGLDRKGKVVLSNRSAEAIVKAGDVLRLSNGILSSIFPEQNRRLQAILTDAVAAGNGSGIACGGALLIDRKSKENSLRITVTPFLSAVPGTSAQLAALVFVSDPAKRPQSRGVALRALYRLTPTEARLADLLLEGLDLHKVADTMGLTLETARFHTKRVLAKTGTRRQAELLRLMLSLPQS